MVHVCILVQKLICINIIDLGGGWGGSQFDMYDASGNLVTSATLSNPLAAFDTLCLPMDVTMLLYFWF